MKLHIFDRVCSIEDLFPMNAMALDGWANCPALKLGVPLKILTGKVRWEDLPRAQPCQITEAVHLRFQRQRPYRIEGHRIGRCPARHAGKNPCQTTQKRPRTEATIGDCNFVRHVIVNLPLQDQRAWLDCREQGLKGAGSSTMSVAGPSNQRHGATIGTEPWLLCVPA